MTSRILAGLVVTLALSGGAAQAQDSRHPLGPGAFSLGPASSGEDLYKGVCQACHMADGKGASGAGAYPALAGDARLQSGAYAAMVITRGQKGMPPFGEALSDGQIADVANYIRSNFGNHFEGRVTPEMVKALRLPPPKP